MSGRKTLIWGLAALLAAGWTGLVWLAHQLSLWTLGALETGALKDAGGALARLPLPPLPGWLAPWFDAAWASEVQGWGADLLVWLGGVLPSGETLMAWVGPLFWAAWGLGVVALLTLAALAQTLAGRLPTLQRAREMLRA